MMTATEAMQRLQSAWPNRSITIDLSLRHYHDFDPAIRDFTSYRVAVSAPDKGPWESWTAPTIDSAVAASLADSLRAHKPDSAEINSHFGCEHCGIDGGGCVVCNPGIVEVRETETAGV